MHLTNGPFISIDSNHFWEIGILSSSIVIYYSTWAANIGPCKFSNIFHSKNLDDCIMHLREGSESNAQCSLGCYINKPMSILY